MVEIYILAMGGHFYFSFSGGVLRQFEHQLRSQFQSSGKGDPLILGAQAPNLSNHHIAVLDRQQVQADPEIFEPFLRLGTVHVVILPIMPPQGIQAWLWAVLLKNDFILPDISLELPDVFVHSITLHKKCV